MRLSNFFKSKRKVWITGGTTVSQMFLIVLLSRSTKILATVFPNLDFTLNHSGARHHPHRTHDLHSGSQCARRHPHRTHDLRSGSHDHHPSKNSVYKTICCNSTSNAPDDGRMYPKHVALRIHQYITLLHQVGVSLYFMMEIHRQTTLKYWILSHFPVTEENTLQQLWDICSFIHVLHMSMCSGIDVLSNFAFYLPTYAQFSKIQCKTSIG